jgi:hypothetical protein
MPSLVGLALQQKDLAGRIFGRGPHAFDARCATVRALVHAPFVQPAIDVGAGRRAFVHQELGHVESDAAGADDGHPGAGPALAGDHIKIRAAPWRGRCRRIPGWRGAMPVARTIGVEAPGEEGVGIDARVEA